MLLFLTYVSHNFQRYWYLVPLVLEPLGSAAEYIGMFLNFPHSHFKVYYQENNFYICFPYFKNVLLLCISSLLSVYSFKSY